MSIGCLRAEVTDTEWIAGWASPSLSTQPAFEDTDPDERTGGSIVDPDKGVAEVIGWLREQLGRPIDRRIWRAGGEVVGEVWSLEDSARALVGLEPSEEAERLGPTVETVRVRG